MRTEHARAELTAAKRREAVRRHAAATALPAGYQKDIASVSKLLWWRIERW